MFEYNWTILFDSFKHVPFHALFFSSTFIHIFILIYNLYYNNRYQKTLENVKKALSKLEELSIPYKRPDDYFAEMVKTDEHMLKIKVCFKR